MVIGLTARSDSVLVGSFGFFDGFDSFVFLGTASFFVEGTGLDSLGGGGMTDSKTRTVFSWYPLLPLFSWILWCPRRMVQLDPLSQ